jgi:hypothetical protein
VVEVAVEVAEVVHHGHLPGGGLGRVSVSVMLGLGPHHRALGTPPQSTSLAAAASTLEGGR